MPRPWKLIESVATPEGPLDLRQRGEGDFMIQHAGHVLMTSAYHRSELAVAELACERLQGRRAPRVLIGGAGLGYTLRATLDHLPMEAEVTVAELNPVILRWCQGPVASLTHDAFGDPRTHAIEGDVMQVIRGRARIKPPWDAIVLDLYMGPDDEAQGGRHPLYGNRAVASMHAALTPGGVLSVWGEEPSLSYERRLRRTGFEAQTIRTTGPGPHHAIFLATRS